MEGSDRDGEIESVMVVTTPSSKGMKSRKRKREVEELSSPSVDAVSEKNLRETAPMILARWKTTAYKSSSGPRRLTEIAKEIEVSTSLVTEEDFKPQKAGSKKGSTSGQTWEVDVGREWISSEHQAVGKQVSNDPLEKNATRNTARPLWVALETMKELEDCLKKLDQGVSRKRRNWDTQQKAEVNKLELGSQLKRTWQSLLRVYFEEAMRTPSSALPLMAKPFVRTAGQLMYAWSLMGIELEVLTSCDKLKVGNKNRSTGIEKEDDSRQSLENHRKLDEIRRFHNKKFEEGHNVHRNLALTEGYARPNKKGEYQYVSGVMGIAYNPFLNSEAASAYRNHEVAELLKFWTEKIIVIDPTEREKPSLGLITEPKVISVPRSTKRIELRMGNGNGMMTTNLGTVWKLLRPSWCPHPHAILIEEVTERVRLTPTKDEDLGTLDVIHKLILPQSKESMGQRVSWDR